MLKTIFNFRGTDYQVNKIPENYANLGQAAAKICEMHMRWQGKKQWDENDAHSKFRFSVQKSNRPE